jgi:hypothetical protein
LQLRERLPRPGQALREIRAVQQHRVVAREVLAVVVEHGQAVLVELRISRVDVDRIDLALGDGFVRESVIEAARRLEGQLVGALQSRPAVGAPDEFLRKPRRTSGGTRVDSRAIFRRIVAAPARRYY